MSKVEVQAMVTPRISLLDEVRTSPSDSQLEERLRHVSEELAREVKRSEKLESSNKALVNENHWLWEMILRPREEEDEIARLRAEIAEHKAEINRLKGEDAELDLLDDLALAQRIYRGADRVEVEKDGLAGAFVGVSGPGMIVVFPDGLTRPNAIKRFRTCAKAIIKAEGL